VGDIADLAEEGRQPVEGTELVGVLLDVLTVLRWLPVGLTAPVTVLLAQSRGLSLAEIGLLFTVHGAIVVALEQVSAASCCSASGGRSTRVPSRPGTSTPSTGSTRRPTSRPVCRGTRRPTAAASPSEPSSAACCPGCSTVRGTSPAATRWRCPTGRPPPSPWSSSSPSYGC
jgi:hypothetical protein